MSQAYKTRRRAATAPAARTPQAGIDGPPMGEPAAGARPTSAQMGSRVDLPGEIREKMEQSFGADFSNVRLYESETVADAGAEAVTQGNSIAFAPGKLDFTSTSGQALLGHELSHVVSQARGESAGQGFLNDQRLEAQADRQGMMAAQGQSVYSGPVSPVGVSSTAGTAGPMQAKKKENDDNKPMTPARQFEKNFNSVKMGRNAESREAGRREQLKMLFDVGYQMNYADEMSEDERAEMEGVRQKLIGQITGGRKRKDYMDSLLGMRHDTAEQMLNTTEFMVGKRRFIRGRMDELASQGKRKGFVRQAYKDYNDLNNKVRKNKGKLDPSLINQDAESNRTMAMSKEASYMRSMDQMLGQFGTQKGDDKILAKHAAAGGDDPVAKVMGIIDENKIQQYTDAMHADPNKDLYTDGFSPEETDRKKREFAVENANRWVKRLRGEDA